MNTSEIVAAIQKWFSEYSQVVPTKYDQDNNVLESATIKLAPYGVIVVDEPFSRVPADHDVIGIDAFVFQDKPISKVTFTLLCGTYVLNPENGESVPVLDYSVGHPSITLVVQQV